MSEFYINRMLTLNLISEKVILLNDLKEILSQKRSMGITSDSYLYGLIFKIEILENVIKRFINKEGVVMEDILEYIKEELLEAENNELARLYTTQEIVDFNNKKFKIKLLRLKLKLLEKRIDKLGIERFDITSKKNYDINESDLNRQKLARWMTIHEKTESEEYLRQYQISELREKIADTDGELLMRSYYNYNEETLEEAIQLHEKRLKEIENINDYKTLGEFFESGNGSYSKTR